MRNLKDESGVTAVIAAICLVVLFAALMLTADAGNLWQTRRNVITATDATALSAARNAALNGVANACSNWQTVLKANTGNDVSPGSCTTTILTPSSGYVTITATKASKVNFGGPLGVGDKDVYSMSSAIWGNLTSVLGVRPIGICNTQSSISQWLGTGTSTDVEVSPGVFRIPFNKVGGSSCGSAPGNWGFIDFDGGGNSNKDLEGWLANGYDKAIAPDDCNADGVTGDPCLADTGSSGGSLNGTLDALIANETQFAIVIFDGATGSGNTVEYSVDSFVGVILRGYKLNGGSGNNSDYLDLEFTNLIWRGGCCTPNGTNTGLRGIKLCSADHDPIAIATRCK